MIPTLGVNGKSYDGQPTADVCSDLMIYSTFIVFYRQSPQPQGMLRKLFVPKRSGRERVSFIVWFISAIGFMVLFSPPILLYYFCRSGGADVGSGQCVRAAAPLTLRII